MFARSLDLVDECGLTHLHVFPFSPRPGTPAARMPQVAREIVKERATAPAREGRGGAAARISTARSARGGACWPSRMTSAAPSNSRQVRLAAPGEPRGILDLTSPATTAGS